MGYKPEWFDKQMNIDIGKGIDFFSQVKRVKGADENNIGLLELDVITPFAQYIQVNHGLIVPSSLRQPAIGTIGRLNFDVHDSAFISLDIEIESDRLAGGTYGNTLFGNRVNDFLYVDFQ